jgi:hypothetical protein
MSTIPIEAASRNWWRRSYGNFLPKRKCIISFGPFRIKVNHSC